MGAIFIPIEVKSKGDLLLMDEKLEVIIDGNGNIEVKTLGIKGKNCDHVVDKIMVGLGAQDVSSKHTGEFFEDGDNPVEIFTK